MEAYSPHPRFVFHCNPGCSKKQFYFVKGVDSHIKIIIIFVRNNKRIKKTVP